MAARGNGGGRKKSVSFMDGPDGKGVRCERAASELRYGRPIKVRQGDKLLAVLALDTATPDTYDRFAGALDGAHQLYLTPPRAAVLDMEAPKGALVPLAGLSYGEACELGYMRAASAPEEWKTGTVLAAEAAGMAKLALLLPCIVCGTVAADDPAFEGCAEVSVGDLAEGWVTVSREFRIVARAPVPLKDVGTTEFIVFRGGLAQRDQIAIVVGKPDFSQPVPVRVHSSCITGDLFGSLKCDCGDQLRLALKTLHAQGGGVLLYLDQEGRGTGIASKMRAYRYQHEGLDTVDADAELGFATDERRYEAAVSMLATLGIKYVELLTNNPAKVAYLRASGIDVVGRRPVIGAVTPENANYLRTKASRAGHKIDLAALIEK